MNQRYIGIIGAMDEEIHELLQRMENVAQKNIQSTTYYTGTINQTPIVVCKSGVGKVNAAICTQIMIDTFQVEAVLFTGVAGAVDPDLDIGDLVISSECQYHDMDASKLGFAKGEIPYQETSVFLADPDWINWAKKAGAKLDGVNVKVGKVVSGDQFISDPAKVSELREQFSASCVEMEGAAVAHVCHFNRVPYVVIRSISDRADHSADVNFVEFVRLAADRSCHMVTEMLRLRANEGKSA